MRGKRIYGRFSTDKDFIRVDTISRKGIAAAVVIMRFEGDEGDVWLNEDELKRLIKDLQMAEWRLDDPNPLTN